MSPLAPQPLTALQVLMRNPVLNPIRRALGVRTRYEIWTDASKNGYGFHLGPKDNVLDAWHIPRLGRVAPHFFSSRPPSAPANPPKMVPLPNGPGDNVSTPPGYLLESDDDADAAVNVARAGPTNALLDKLEASTELHEAVAMCIALNRWAPLVRGGNVTCYTDNHSVAMALTTGPKSTKHHSKVIVEIQELAEQHSIKLKAQWVPRTQNNLADQLSRMKKEHPQFSPAVTAMLARDGDAGEKEMLRKILSKVFEEPVVKSKQKDCEGRPGVIDVVATANPPVVEQVAAV